MKIEHVCYYINPLVLWKIEDTISTILILCSDRQGYWWSNEKNSKGIILQRSMKEENVRDIFEHKVRITADITVLSIELKNDDPGARDIIFKHVIGCVLINKCLLTYHYAVDNCIHYADRSYYIPSLHAILGNNSNCRRLCWEYNR
jgi:hypothetical protein